ncbi:hypothetical protein [Duganella sp. Root1480D1]|uniref:hypothetical protein n=1 Tax=Duganella sp. Root1480D1 TaxID=1736471 RepID=UPI000710DB6A|nr:hypothetical protein [Duganella sp. Root1480D1]KQZ32451.1 hypothetical protein ASD58_07380 [Duganella sp. Root1480D1]
MSKSTQNESPVIHVKVTVQKNGDVYQATYDPKIIDVNDLDTILHFKLVTPTPDDIVIRSVSISPEAQDQLSTPSISKNGKSVTLSDLNTASQTFNLTFSYRNKHNENLQVKKSGDNAVDYPEVVNNPPGFEPMLAMAIDSDPVNNPPG